MGDLFFGAPRPETTVSARIDLKIPISKRKGAIGRPFKAWTGTSDADEADVYVQICENPFIGKVIKDRDVLQDGSIILQGTLFYSEGNQVADRHEIEISYIHIGNDDNEEGMSAFATRVLETYAKVMAEIRQANVDVIKANSETYSRMSEAFSKGLGKVSKHNKGLGKITRRLERDREALVTALLKAASVGKTDAGAPPSKLVTGIEAVTLLTRLAEKAKGSGDSNV